MSSRSHYIVLEIIQNYRMSCQRSWSDIISNMLSAIIQALLRWQFHHYEEILPHSIQEVKLTKEWMHTLTCLNGAGFLDSFCRSSSALFSLAVFHSAYFSFASTSAKRGKIHYNLLVLCCLLSVNAKK